MGRMLSSIRSLELRYCIESLALEKMKLLK